jgi:hypothetical protein
MSTPALTTWPGFCAQPEQVQAWLNKQRPADEVGKKIMLTLRWMVNEELERRRPDPVPAAITDFIPDEPSQPLP